MDNSGRLVIYVIASEIVTTLATPGYPDILNCYYDVEKNGIILVRSGSNMEFFDFANMVAYGFYSTPETNFYIDPTTTYITMTINSTVNLYIMPSVAPCIDGTYWDNVLQLCASCTTGCATCTSTQICTSCTTGYFLDVNCSCWTNSTTNDTSNSISNSTLNSTINASVNTTANSTVN